MTKDTSLEERFNHFVVKKDGCWDWNGCCPVNPGYGQFRFNMKLVRAHRASWIIHNGPIPTGKHVLHKCDNPRCANPEHLFLGTAKDNMRDCRKKGRTTEVGETHSFAVLTEKKVILIKELIKLGFKNRVIADILRVQRPRISDIKCHRTWKHVQEDLS